MYAQPTLNGTPAAPASFSNMNTFGATSVRIIPDSSVLQNGYLVGQGFPAENENYLMYNTTLSINALANDLSNIHAEILTVLTGQSITPNGTEAQLNTAIGNKITSTITASYINSAVTGAGISTALQAYGGNVGIGKSPSYVLDVNGIINGSSVYIAGVSVITSLSLKANLASPTFTGTVTVPDGASDTSAASVLQLNNSSGYAGNISFIANCASNELSIIMKTFLGANDPGASPGGSTVVFRGITATTVGNVVKQQNSYRDLVVPSGATLGQTSGVPGFLYIYAISLPSVSDNIELAISGTDCWADGSIVTTVAISTSSDSIDVLYSNVVVSRAVRYLGFIKISQATAGTWVTQPTFLGNIPCSRNLTPKRASTLRSAATSITTATPKTFASLTLAIGTWKIKASGGVLGASGTIFQSLITSISLTTNTLPATDTTAVPSISGELRNQLDVTSSATGVLSMSLQEFTVSIAASTTFYLVLQASFTVSTAIGFGNIEATFVHT